MKFSLLACDPPGAETRGTATRCERIGLGICALAALGVSVYLLLGSFSAEPIAGCGPGSGCDQVLLSRWAYVLGVPVSAVAVGMWFLVILLLIAGLGTVLSRVLVVGLFVMAAGSAAWFVGLQIFELGVLCPWCTGAHAIGLTTTALGMIVVGPHLGARSRRVGYAIGVVGVGLLIGGQLLWAPPSHRIETVGALGGESHGREITLLGGRVGLDPDTLPTLGDADASGVGLLLADYTCVHCRALHGMVRQAQQRYAGQLAVVMLHAPLDATCNPTITQTAAWNRDACSYARLALAVYAAERMGVLGGAEAGRGEAFEAFDAYLMRGERPPELSAARAKAAELVGAQALSDALANPWIDQRISANLRLQTLLGQARVPILLAGENMLIGKPTSVDAVFAMLETSLDLTPPPASTPVSTPTSTPAPTPAPSPAATAIAEAASETDEADGVSAVTSQPATTQPMP